MHSLVKVIKIDDHRLEYSEINKVLLSSYYDKQYLRENGVANYVYDNRLFHHF